jgi:hypothetical protein
MSDEFAEASADPLPPEPVSDVPVDTAPAPGDYPMVLYHRTQPPQTVSTPAQRAALGSDWRDTPVTS